ncbi:sodium:solute symporter family protein [Salinibacillus xinjiangensis]|uniref:Sodium:solute symporter family protein n=1 Tax=Salinibacillus xinjiangensis TaxID=1229268 RepID=A0A6G1X9C4_9BACI|nr:sodium:solute symporter family protein [Salinibacillus xinjiangensis]MRG87574.1 sodium:solute symporter family protein [Salinibacillus xinjiangensis]
MKWELVLITIVYFIVLFYFIRKGSKKSDSIDDFTVGGWSMGIIVNVGFFTATWVSAASVLGVPSLLYSLGFAAVTGWFAGWFFANALLPFIAYKLRKPKFPVRTIPEFMRLRYEPHVKHSKLQVWSSLIMVVGYISYVTIQITGIGYLVSAMTGLSYQVSIFIFLLFTLVTVLGGVWSVALTDLFNTAVIVVGLAIAAFMILPQVGGVTEMFIQAGQITTPDVVGGTAMTEGGMFSPLGTFSIAAMVGIFLSNSLGASVAPHWPTRLLSAKNVKTAIMTPLLSNAIIFIVFSSLLVIGIGGRVLVPTMPEGMATDQIFPLLITDYMNPVIGGIVLAAIFAAALSTANGMILQSTIAITYDIFRNMSKKRVKDSSFIKITQGLLIVVAIIATLFALNPPAFIAMVAAYVFGLFGAAFIGPMYLGLYWKRVNKQAAYSGSITGVISYVVFSVLIETGTIAGVLPAVVWSVLISLTLMIICSYVFKPAPKEAWEPYFVAEVSESTQETIDKAMQRIKEEDEKKEAAV